jgi:hypothetical protein
MFSVLSTWWPSQESALKFEVLHLHLTRQCKFEVKAFASFMNMSPMNYKITLTDYGCCDLKSNHSYLLLFTSPQDAIIDTTGALEQCA